MKTMQIRKLNNNMATTRVFMARRALKPYPHFMYLSLIFLSVSSVWAATWQPDQGPLKTRWAKDVSPENAHPEYPRPQMVRPDWLNLNGLWDVAITSKDAKRATFQTQILVPFPIESALSGVMRPVSENERIWYRRNFEVPMKWLGRRVLLHFGAVDFEATEARRRKPACMRHLGSPAAPAFCTSRTN